MTIENIVDMILKYHAEGLMRSDIHKPFAWAVYQTWKWVDSHEKSRKESEKKMKTMEINFKVVVDEDAVDELKKCINHHIDRLLDLENWPEIRSVYDAKIIENKKNKDLDKCPF